MTATDKAVRVECEACFEWLVSDGGMLRPWELGDDPGVPRFTAPVFEGSRWPNECAVCGAPPSHGVQAKARTVHVAAALVGRLASSSASLGGIPVCDEHDEAMGLEIEQLGTVRLVFPNYPARRRYVVRHKGMIPATVAQR